MFMANKTKTPTIQQKLADVAAQSGMLLMATAATFGMLELPDHPDKRVIVPTRPVFAFADESAPTGSDNTLRREREEAGPHYISYSVSQRTPGRSGKY
jgi:hypothetical protein